MTAQSTRINQVEVTRTAGLSSLYRFGAVAALTMVLLTLLDITVSMVTPGGDTTPGMLTAMEWFSVFNTSPLQGLRDLGLLNILNLILIIPVFYALYLAHQQPQRLYAGLALMLALFAGAIYIANNAALPLLALSNQYSQVATEAQRVALVAAGDALLARGADFTLGSLIGLVLSSSANLLLAWVVLCGEIFGKLTGYAGLVGTGCLLIFTIWTTLAPESFDLAMLLALPGGLLMLAWNILIARKLLRLGGES